MPWKTIFEDMAADRSAYNYSCNEQLLRDDKLIINTAPAFFGKLNTALGNASLLNTSWKPFLRTHYIGKVHSTLSKDFETANLLLQKWASGISESASRQKTCTDHTVNSLSVLADSAFMHKFFPPQARRDAMALLNYTKRAFVERLKNVEWMVLLLCVCV